MNTIKTIIISALTYYFLNFIGPFAIVLWCLGIWAGLGYLGVLIDERYSVYKKNSMEMVFLFITFGPIWMICAIAEYYDSWTEELREIKARAFPEEQ
jgi:hypothetical protein